VAEGTVPGGPVSETTSEGFVPQPVSQLPDVPGAVSTRPDVLGARSAVTAARDEFVTEADQLRRSARATFDIKARIRGIPERARQDPARAAAAAGLATGAVIGLGALVARSRRPKAYGVLPEDVDKILGRIGPEGAKIRASLESGFAAYLREYGAQVPQRRRRVPLAIQLFVLPVAATATRAMIRRLAAPPAAGVSWRDRFSPGSGEGR
jgi:hypothetical protein